MDETGFVSKSFVILVVCLCFSGCNGMRLTNTSPSHTDWLILDTRDLPLLRRFKFV